MKHPESFYADLGRLAALAKNERQIMTYNEIAFTLREAKEDEQGYDKIVAALAYMKAFDAARLEPVYWR